LAAGGASVAAADINEEALAALVTESADMAGTVVPLICNVADEESVGQMVNNASEQLGGLNGLINNAGIFRDGLLVKKNRDTGEIKKLSLKNWNAVINVDLTGPFLCTRDFAAKVIESGTKQSVVVNISSVARHGNMGQSNYSAAKAGLIADTKLWALELARYGVRTGAVAPGFVNTPILQGMRPDVLEGMLKAVPLRRAAEPEEIWMAIKFIIECDYFTGRCIDVDGGITI
jgi:3-oxoacyl-[acyl-carrier protein] reductase